MKLQIQRLFIAEKPSLGQLVASHLPGSNTKRRGYIENSNGDVITWCFGHLYKLAPVSYYLNGSSGFKMEELPIIPKQWEIVPDDDRKDQIDVIRSLLGKAKTVVHAGDADREGQRIVDSVLEKLGNRAPVYRLWLQGQDDISVKRALAALKDNRDYKHLNDAAYARACADWLVGMNMSTAMTQAAKKTGFVGTLSIGRVQTPTLALVVKRDIEIENFVPKDYWRITATVIVPTGKFQARYA